MVKKICEKIGQFIKYCLSLTEEEQTKVEEFKITNDTYKEWLFGIKGDEDGSN